MWKIKVENRPTISVCQIHKTFKYQEMFIEIL